KATGKPADEYAKEHLFTPLGIEYYWKRTPKGLADTEGGLYLKPRDLAKLGDLYMHDGVWRGARVLPAGWAAESTQPRVKAEEKYGYGYQWWVMPEASISGEKAYAARGYGGQFLFVVPRIELIAVFTGWNIYDKPELDPILALGRVLKGVRDSR